MRNEATPNIGVGLWRRPGRSPGQGVLCILSDSCGPSGSQFGGSFGPGTRPRSPAGQARILFRSIARILDPRPSVISHDSSDPPKPQVAAGAVRRRRMRTDSSWRMRQGFEPEPRRIARACGFTGPSFASEREAPRTGIHCRCCSVSRWARRNVHAVSTLRRRQVVTPRRMFLSRWAAAPVAMQPGAASSGPVRLFGGQHTVPGVRSEITTQICVCMCVCVQVGAKERGPPPCPGEEVGALARVHLGTARWGFPCSLFDAGLPLPRVRRPPVGHAAPPLSSQGLRLRPC